MATLAERCKAAGLLSAAELTRITATSKETLTNWMKDKPVLFEVVLKGSVSDMELRVLKMELDDLKKGLVYQATLDACNKSKIIGEQTWCFSPEDLQEQAKLIERLTADNQRLQAENSLLSRQESKQQLERDIVGFTLQENYDALLQLRSEDKAELEKLRAENSRLKNQKESKIYDVAEIDKVRLYKALSAYKAKGHHGYCEATLKNGESCTHKGTEYYYMDFDLYVCPRHKPS